MREPVIERLHLLIHDHQPPQYPQRLHGGTDKPLPQQITEAGVAAGPRIAPRMYSTRIAALAEVQTRTKMGCSIGQSHSPIRRTLLREGRTARVSGVRLIPNGEGIRRGLGTYRLVAGFTSETFSSVAYVDVGACISSTSVRLSASRA